MENDLIRRSDLLAKKCVVRGHLDPSSQCPTKVVAIPVDVIERAPSVDAVEVVRCKDCVLSGNCLAFDTFRLVAGIENPFCCVGRRKEGDEDG